MDLFQRLGVLEIVTLFGSRLILPQNIKHLYQLLSSYESDSSTFISWDKVS